MSRHVGRISYSLYLCHWPVIVLVAALLPRQTALQDPIAVLLMVGLSVASYHFIERPLRGLSRASLRGLSFGALRGVTLRFSRAGIVVALSSVTCVAAGVALFHTVPPPAHQSFGVAVADATAARLGQPRRIRTLQNHRRPWQQPSSRRWNRTGFPPSRLHWMS